MKKMMFTLVMALIGVVAYSQEVTYVQGYYKKDGTYVQGHYRTKANNTVMDNFSTYPNVNTYTGEIGTKHITDNNYYDRSNSYTQPSSNYQINSLYQTNPVYNTNDLYRTNTLFQTNSLFR
jgi:hypothetical protein